MGQRRKGLKIHLDGKKLQQRDRQAYMYGLETMALTEKQQEKVQVCEKQLDKKNHGSEDI